MALQKFPGFIDVHVHLRDPGATHKEDFASGSRAAIKGGFTYILDMPNNPTPTFNKESLEDKINRSKTIGLCDIGFHFGTNGKNTDQFPLIWGKPAVFGLKVYYNHTTGEFLIDNEALLEQVFKEWSSSKPILVHAEGERLERTIALAKQYNRRLHVCHISQASEVTMVAAAKKTGQQISAGVTPHHLFMTDADIVTKKGFAMMKPPLGTKQDQEALWDGINKKVIDVVETDHAPHTIEEKSGDKPVFGVPGLETAVGLLFKVVKERRISQSQVIDLLYTAPKRIFAIPDQEQTYVELDPDLSYSIGSDGYATKCGWSPYDGWQAYGQVQTVTMQGKKIYDNGKFI